MRAASYLPNMPNPTGPTVLPATLVSADLPVLMVEDVTWNSRWE